MKAGDVVSFESSFVVNPEPPKPLMQVGDIVTVGADGVPYRVAQVVDEDGIQMFQLVPASADDEVSG